MEVTYKYRAKYIDTIAATAGILEIVDGCEITNFKEIIYIDYQRYIIDFNLKAYFKLETFHIDCNEGSMLDSSRKSHRNKFIEKAEELIESFRLIDTFNEHCNEYASREMLDKLDKEMISILNIVRKHVKDLKRKVPFSKAKLKTRAKVLY